MVSAHVCVGVGNHSICLFAGRHTISPGKLAFYLFRARLLIGRTRRHEAGDYVQGRAVILSFQFSGIDAEAAVERPFCIV